MSTKQPRWKMIANLGDVNPVDYGGYFVYVDMTGVYPPEGEILLEQGDSSEGWTVYRFTLDQCTYINDVLSDNQYHPELSAWFAEDLSHVASFIGQDVDELRADICSDDPIRLASAYRAIGDYHGFDNLDSYPRIYNKRSELPRRMRRYNGRR